MSHKQSQGKFVMGNAVSCAEKDGKVMSGSGRQANVLSPVTGTDLTKTGSAFVESILAAVAGTATHTPQMASLTAPSANSSIRAEALRNFEKLGIPSPSEESWKYTNLQALNRFSVQIAAPAAQPSSEDIARFSATADGHRFVFVNGHFSPGLSNLQDLPPGVFLGTFSDVLRAGTAADEFQATNYFGKLAHSSEQSFVALNTGLFSDGIVLRVKANTEMQKPINVLYLSDCPEGHQVIAVRNLIVLEEGASAKVLESYASLNESTHLTTSVTEIFCEERSSLEHIKTQRESTLATHIGLMYVRQKSDSRLNTNNFSFGGGTVRNEIHPVLDGERIESLLHGLTVLAGSQHVDNTTVIDHAKPNCFSRELYKGIYQDASSGAFSGTIIVRPDAQKTNAIQSNQSLLLSPDANVDTRPQLKIYADDVKCTHGATIGQLDDEGLFYIRSRGIDQVTAQAMLVHAFASDIIGYITLPDVRDYLEGLLKAAIESNPLA